MAGKAWEKAKELIRDPGYRMVLLDEINIAMRYGYVAVADVVAFLQAEKPLTEMELIKHPFRAGVTAQAGVAF